MRNKIQWSFLRFVGNSIPAKLTVVFPFVGNLVIFNDYMKDFMGGLLYSDGALVSSMSIDLLLSVYFVGFLFLGVGNVLFLFFCDEVVRSYSSPEDFNNKTLDRTYIEDLRSMCLFIERNAEACGIDLSSGGFYVASDIITGNPESLEDDSKAFLLKKYYIVKDLMHPYVRIAIFFCYVIGFLFILFPMMRTLVRAAKIIIENFAT